MPAPSTSAQASRWIKSDGLIAIVRGNFPLAHLLAIAETLHANGLTVMEVTLNSANALEAIARLRVQAGEGMLVGAGTVRTAPELEAAWEAGAQFTVAPNFDAAAARLAQERDRLHLPGVFTATEAETAFRAGCRMVKLFPSDVVGPKYLAALRAPLHDIEFIPTGGIDRHNIAEYCRLGAVACGIGSALVTGPQQAMADLAERAQALRRGWESATHL